MVLSQATSATMPSNMWPRTISSIESAITSRLMSEAFIPSVPMVTPSLMAMVLNSMGVPTAPRIPSFTLTASKRRYSCSGRHSNGVQSQRHQRRRHHGHGGDEGLAHQPRSDRRFDHFAADERGLHPL